jgi:DNA-directed RNA polymerase specialized sigma24 family protein
MDSRMKSLNLFASDLETGHLTAQAAGSKTSQDTPMSFEERFWQWRDSLFFIAHRVLGDEKLGAEAVENCFLTASRNAPKFATDGAFGSWILRILIDEAVLLHCDQKSRAAHACEQAVSGLTMTIF